MHSVIHGFKLLLLVLLLTGVPVFSNSHAQEGETAYTVTMNGALDEDLQKLLEQVSDTVNLKDRPPASLGLLKRRVEKDVPVLDRALRSRGYYGAEIKTEMDASADPVRVALSIDTGPAYLLKGVDISPAEGSPVPDEPLPSPARLGLELNAPARSSAILEANRQLLRWFMNRGFPFARTERQEVVIDHEDESVTVHYVVDQGPFARFGPVGISGLQSVDEGFVRNRIPWKKGEIYRAESLEKAEEVLLATGLFGFVDAGPGEKVGADGLIPVELELKERKHRTIKAGASYMTDEGPGVTASWEHRNFFGKGERLHVQTDLTGIAYAGEMEFRKPDFLRMDQSLFYDLRLAEDHPDAFTSRSASSELGVERELGEGMNASLALGFRHSRIEQFGTEETHGLLSLPGRFHWDTSNDLLDPVTGGRLSLEAAPFYDFLGDDAGGTPGFFKGYAQYTHYFPLLDNRKAVFAGRIALGGLWGEERDNVPADLRFYAGGGGSIRGYAYQSVGPLRGDEPLGGRSLMEISGELRFKVTESIGLVAFLDGGSAFTESVPDFEEDILWGAGLGVRYFTRIGPLRMDVGFPLDRREDLDDAFQVYISIGQAF